uniref:F-box protein AT5G49610-like beta-propeller domain-containing protein n=1 Tax=Triticum aestivum TaxID=4565 RepID=A0A3B6NJ28_WHEAT
MPASSHPPSPASPLEDDNLLPQILLRLPPDPSSLPRASLACTRWRNHVADPGFRRRFRLHHRRNPPLLGFFDGCGSLDFMPTLEAPDRVAPERFSLQRDEGDGVCRPLGSRHGLMLIIVPKRLQVLVWDPFTGDQHRLDVPPGLTTNGWDERLINGAVLRAAAGDSEHFQVVLVAADGGQENRRAVACVYSSETGAWGGFITTPLPNHGHASSLFSRYSTSVYMDHAVLAGDSLYWQLIGNFQGILQFDLERQMLDVMPVPVPIYSKGNCFKLMRAKGGGGGIGFLFMSNSNYIAQLWSRKTDADGVASWVIGRSIELDKLLSLRSGKENIRIVGFAEDNNVVLMDMLRGFFMIQLDSMQFKKLARPKAAVSCCHAFESVYAASSTYILR